MHYKFNYSLCCYLIDNQIFINIFINYSYPELRLIRTIIDTQEKERVRFARDIHDSLGQQLSAINFYLSTLSASGILDEKKQKLLDKSSIAINQIMASAREICFNLMPQTLEKFGLFAAVEELCKNVSTNIRFKIICNQELVRLSREKEISIFRIIQEFIGNSIKYSSAKVIRITFTTENENLKVELKDDGVGFDLNEIIKENRGMGLKNVISRAKSHNGELEISSRLDSGVKYIISIPL